MSKQERTLENLRDRYKGKIYILLKDKKTEMLFFENADAEGYRFGKKSIKDSPTDCLVSLGHNKQLSFLNFVGRIEFQCNGGDNAAGRFWRVDYYRYINGYKDFLI